MQIIDYIIYCNAIMIEFFNYSETMYTAIIISENNYCCRYSMRHFAWNIISLLIKLALYSWELKIAFM